MRDFGPDERRSGNEGGPREPGTRVRSSDYLLARRMAEYIYLDPFLSLALIAKAAPVRPSLEDLAPGRMIARRRTHLIKPRAGELRK